MAKILNQLIELAAERKTEAAQYFSQIVKKLEQAKDRLSLLEQYRDDYEIKKQDCAAQGMSGVELTNYLRFISQLEEAIEQQQLEVKHIEVAVISARDAFVAEERKLKSFEVLAKREEQKTFIKENRQQQKQTDEFGNRLIDNPTIRRAIT